MPETQIWTIRIQAMTTLTVTARGQVTLRKDVLKHLGIRPGEKNRIGQATGWTSVAQGDAAPRKIDSFLGLLASKSKKVATLDEINEAAASGWAGQK
jgi:hypothetical protein